MVMSPLSAKIAGTFSCVTLYSRPLPRNLFFCKKVFDYEAKTYS